MSASGLSLAHVPHSSIYIRTDSGIDKPEDLKGKVVGVRNTDDGGTLGPWHVAGRVRCTTRRYELAGWRP